MTLIFKSEPSEVAEVIKNKLGQMASIRAFRTPQLARIISKGTAQPPVPTQALPVYHLGLTDLAEDRDLGAAAVQTGWRYSLKHENKVIASAETVFGPDRKPIFAQINEGPLVQGIQSAIRAADAHQGIKKSEYEVRLLMIPALYTAALWLVDTKGGHDMAVPIAPVALPLQPDKPVPVEKLLAVLQNAARAKLSAPQADEPVGG
ncbi:MAG TPA: hypothetical protein VIO11_07980 [Candidatus Methanoperedens sp.]